MGNTGKLIGYARVSTEDQELRLQIDALQAAGCWNIWQEKRSASRGKRRPELDKAMLDLRPGDTLVVWRLDRLARNARELYARLDQIYGAGANFKSLQEQFDFQTPMGKFVLGILALVAELEAQMTAHRTKAGIAAIKERGLRYGARPVLTKAQLRRLREFRKQGEAINVLAKRFKVSTGTIYNYLRQRTKPEK